MGACTRGWYHPLSAWSSHISQGNQDNTPYMSQARELSQDANHRDSYERMREIDRRQCSQDSNPITCRF